MKFEFSLGSAFTAAVCCGVLLGTTACRKSTTTADSISKVPVVIPPELERNNLGSLPGTLYRSQASSAIHWQPWTKDSLKKAEASHRLVFAVVAMQQQAGYQKTLAALEADPGLVSLINNKYLPVLIDGDASREVGLLTSDLCVELRRNLQLPLLLWMTSDGNPVAWIPVNLGEGGKITELFNQSDAMISRTWAEDEAYVMKNSALDNENRRGRISERKNAKVMSNEPGLDVVRALRHLASFYDPYSRTFDQIGGLFPSGAIDLLSTAAIHPGLSPEVRGRCLDTTRELMIDLLPSPMFDPLEGGVFTTRRGSSWALPSFTRECSGQARAAVALLNAYRATGDQRVLDKALGLISFTEKSFQTPEGLFAVGLPSEKDTSLWLWSVEEIEKELAPEDSAWWIKATGMKGLGNLPTEVDTRREYFRSNSLGISKSVAEIGAELGQTPAQFSPRFEAVRKKLLEVRNTRLGENPRDSTPYAGASFRMVSAYAAAFGVTGDVAFRDKAVALLKKSKEAFSNGPRLRSFAQEAPASIGEGRAFLYGLAIQSAMDVAVISSDASWITWSEDLATTAAELFTDSEFLKECPDDAKVIDLPVTDLIMLFDDSTAGLISSAECRLAEQGRPLVDTFSALATPLPTFAVDRPILHTDLLQATIAREFKITVVCGADLSPEMKLATEKLPMRMIQRRPAKAEDKIPAGSVKLIFSSGEKRVVSTPADLQEAALPLAKKS